MARAIENQAYALGVNRVGTDGNGVAYCGDSVALNWLGDELAACSDRQETRTLTLDIEALRAYREKFPAYLDADEFQLVE